MGRPTTAQQQRRQLSRDIIAKQAELGRHPSVLRSKFKQQPAPRVNPQQLELAASNAKGIHFTPNSVSSLVI